MRRRAFIATGGLGLAGAAVLAAPAIAQSQPEIKWRMATSWPKSLDTLFGAAEFLSKRVADATDNQFQIRVFAGGEIVPPFQVLEAVQNNTVEMCHTASYYFVGKDLTMGFDSGVPFGLTARQQNAWMSMGGAEEIDKFGLDLEDLVRQTAERDTTNRERAHRLVDQFLDRMAVGQEPSAR